MDDAGGDAGIATTTTLAIYNDKDSDDEAELLNDDQRWPMATQTIDMATRIIWRATAGIGGDSNNLEKRTINTTPA